MTDAFRPDGAAEAAAGIDVVTLGCRLNLYESDVMRAHARAAGLSDVVIVNTCAVTSEAVRQATQTIRRLRRDRPSARIVVTGCAAQLEPDRFAALDEVDHVIGNADKMDRATFDAIARLDASAHQTGGAKPLVSDIMQVRQTARHLVEGFGSRARAQVEIQNGCDHRCTFCIIPFARGPSRSVPPDFVLDAVRSHVRRGKNEVVLTGVDITSYGGDLAHSAPAPTAERSAAGLGRLVRRILDEVPDLARLRLSSIDQIEADEDLIRAFAEHDRLMPHLHLSLQSGDDLVLKRMKRRHTRASAVGFCERMRALRPDIVFGADIIAGFPTETEAMFENSLKLVDDCGLTYVHAFPYSPRPGTPAARMPQTSRAIAKSRAASLRERGAEALRTYLEGQIGSETTILVESETMGRTPAFAEVEFAAERRPAGVRHGSLMRARLTGLASMHRLEGIPL